MEKDNKKWVYKFEAEKISADKKSNEKLNFAILKANRRIKEDGELFYASETSRFAKAGVLPKAAWNTILSNGGGTISDEERQEYGKLLSDFRDKSFDLQSLLISSEGTRTSEQNQKITDLSSDLDDIRRKLQSFEADQINIFENTAEAKARNRTILWWVLNLSYQEKDGKFEPLFKGASFDEKLDSYDKIEEESSEDTFLMEVIKRITYLVTLWYLGRVETEEDFKQLDEAAQKQEETTEDADKNHESTVEEKPVDEVNQSS